MQQLRTTLALIRTHVDALPTIDLTPVAAAVATYLEAEQEMLSTDGELAAASEEGWADYEAGRFVSHSSAAELVEVLSGVAPRKD